MTIRNVIIIVALTAPLLGLAVLAQSPSMAPKKDSSSADAVKPDAPADQPAAKAGGDNKRKLAPLSTTPVLLPPLDTEASAAETSGQAAQPGGGGKRLAAQPQARTLEDARNRVRNRLKQLEQMTEEEWQAEQLLKEELRQRWQNIPAEERIRMMDRNPSKPARPTPEQKSRLPELAPRPASPPQ